MDKTKAIFLDRDGVINRDSPNYIKDWSEFFFIPKSIEAIVNLYKNNFIIILITNQSAINRKITSKENVLFIHFKITEIVNSENGKIHDIFYCPHSPEENCNCRKPKPEMVLEAQKKYNIDLKNSYFIGDSSKDIECAINAGCKKQILVRTGNFKRAESELNKKNIIPTYIADDLYSASKWIISHNK